MFRCLVGRTGACRSEDENCIWCLGSGPLLFTTLHPPLWEKVYRLWQRLAKSKEL